MSAGRNEDIRIMMGRLVAPLESFNNRRYFNPCEQPTP